MKLNKLQLLIIVFNVIFIGVFLVKNHRNKEFYINVVEDFGNKNYKQLDSLINPQYGVFVNVVENGYYDIIGDYEMGISILKNFKELVPFTKNSKGNIYSNLEFGEIKYIGNGKFKKDDSFFSNFSGQYLLDPNNAIKGFHLGGKDSVLEERLKSITKYKISAISKDQSKNYEFYFGIENHKIYLCAATINPVMSDEGIELEKSYIHSGGENAEYRDNLTKYLNTANFFETPKLLTNLGFLHVTYSDKNIIIGNTAFNFILESIHDNFIQYRINNKLNAIYLSDSINKNFQNAEYRHVFRINGSSKLLLAGFIFANKEVVLNGLQYIDLENITDYGLSEKVFNDTLSNCRFDNGDFSVKQISGNQFSIMINGKNHIIKWDGSKFIGDLPNLKKDALNTSLKNDTLKDTTTLTNGLVAYYPFAGNANDLSGNGNNGMVYGATLTTDRFGNANSAYSFDGISNYILVNNSGSINSPTISISGWFNTNSLSTNATDGCKSIVSKWWQIPGVCNSNHDSYLVTLSYLGNNPTICAATQFYSGVNFFPNLSISTSSWYHFVFIHDATQGGKLYINGNLVFSNQLSGPICYSTNPLYIGVDNNGGTLWRYFNGSIDDIRIYNRVITQAEITYLATH